MTKAQERQRAIDIEVAARMQREARLFVTQFGPQQCENCGETFRAEQERAEVSRDGKHLIVHASCMREGEEIA